MKRNFSELNISVKLQTGEYTDDELFEGDIIFTTIDQTLSNVLGIPLSVPKKLANINAGAVLSSYLIFDEVHLLDPYKSLKTTITLLELLSKITPFCLMTATLSNIFLNNISQKLNADVVKVNDNDYQNFAFVKNKLKKNIYVCQNIIAAEDVLKSHQNKSIVICNTVDRCISLYKELQKTCKEKDIELLCIHSRFFQKDRKEKEDKITELFGKDSDANSILISTQVIEVGLDISCEVMHTEISPINSFLQRIGRCARWGDNGTIFVYEVPENKYAPYDSKLSKLTFTELAKYQQMNLDYYLYQTLIENVLGKYENKIYEEINYSSEDTWQNIHNSWRTGDQSFSRALIRDIRSINIVLLPADFKTDSLYKYEAVSMNPYSLKKKVKDILDSYEGEQPTLLMKLEESNFSFFEDANNDYLEEKVLEHLELDKLYLENIVALNSQEIKYSRDYGLNFESGENINSEEKERKGKFQYQIKMDTYKQHINWMLKVLEDLLYISYPLKKIHDYQYQSFDLNEILKLIVVMHDYGKLNNLWQNIVCDYQKQKAKNTGQNYIDTYLAHTDFDPNSEHDKNLLSDIYGKNRVNKKPEHSGIGAFVTMCLLPTVMNLERNRENESMLKIITTTILRHHSASSKSAPNYEISESAIKFHNNELLKAIVPQFYQEDTTKIPFAKYRGTDLSSEIIQFENNIETILYFLLVRVLRICDQKSFDFNK